MTTSVTFCQICPAFCGLRVEVRDGRLAGARGDHENPLSQGYLCFKGRTSVDLYDSPERVTQARARDASGVSVPIAVETALDEIHDQLTRIVARHGPEAVALYYGTGANMNSLTHSAMKAWLSTVGSPFIFSSMTIDQSAKWVTAGRLGVFGSGRRDVSDADVLLLAGLNPAVSHYTSRACDMSRPAARLREFRERGGKVIVVDPRATETARTADLHLQIRPGEDVALFAGLIRLVLDRGWHDAEFCSNYVDSLAALRSSVAPFTLSLVSARTGLSQAAIEAAAELFAGSGRSSALSGTGANMGPQSNLVDHLIEALNAVCGGYRRAGDRVGNVGSLFHWGQPTERAIRPNRTWERGAMCRTAPIGPMGGEYPTALLPREIVGKGDDRLRALIVVGGNPVTGLGDPAVTIPAFASLELLVTLDPRETDTTRLSHYHIATSLPYEQPAITAIFDRAYCESFAQMVGPVTAPPPDTIADWQFFWGLTRRQGVNLPLKRPAFGLSHADIPGDVLELPPDSTPTAAEIIQWMGSQGRVSYEELVNNPHGVRVPDAESVVAPHPPGDDGRLDLCPVDVRGEIALALTRTTETPRGFRLINRRMLETMNSAYTKASRVRDRYPTNPTYLNPDDMASLGIAAGDNVTVTSDHGSVPGKARPDDTLPKGVIAISHGWTGLDGHGQGDLGSDDAFTGALISITLDVEPINFMPQFTGVPVTVSTTGPCDQTSSRLQKCRGED